MLIKVQELVGAWSIGPTGVIHVGAHAAEESSDYQRYGLSPVIWIEANPMLIDRLKETVPTEDTVICAALWDDSLNLLTTSTPKSMMRNITKIVQN